METEEIRWQQRFSNYQRALARLEEGVETVSKNNVSDLEKEGLVQRFEYTFELAWKTLQDLLVFKGYSDITGPNPVLEQSLKDGYLEDEKGWRAMKKSRELTSHTYDSETAEAITSKIVESFHTLLKALEVRLQNEIK